MGRGFEPHRNLTWGCVATTKLIPTSESGPARGLFHSSATGPARGNQTNAPHGARDGPNGPERRCLMADEPSTNPAQEGGSEPDYKALYEQWKSESRKWEERAKANKDKADKWDAAAGGEESLEARLSKLEAENRAMKDAERRHALVAKVASETGLAESLVSTLNGADEETLLAQAKSVAALKPTGAPNAPEAGTFPRDGDVNTKSNADRFGEIIQNALR